MYELCHGLPRSIRRVRKRELDALAETHDVSVLFPCVRPRDPVFEAYAEQVASALDPADPCVPVDAVEGGIALLDEAECRRIVDEWVRAYPDRWGSVCTAVGDPSLVARAFVASAVRGAMTERRPVSRDLVALFEGGKLQRSPVAALGLVLAPPLVWNCDAVALFRVEIVLAKGLSAAQFDDALAVAFEYVGDGQVQRVRAVSARLGHQLPIAGLPTASKTLRRGCGIVASDDAAASELAALLLVMYQQALPKRGRLSLGRVRSRSQDV